MILQAYYLHSNKADPCACKERRIFDFVLCWVRSHLGLRLFLFWAKWRKHLVSYLKMYASEMISLWEVVALQCRQLQSEGCGSKLNDLLNDFVKADELRIYPLHGILCCGAFYLFGMKLIAFVYIYLYI